MKAVAFSEALLLLGLLALAWFVFVQQEQLALLEQDLDRLRNGGLQPPILPMEQAGNSANSTTGTQPKPPRPRAPRKPKP